MSWIQNVPTSALAKLQLLIAKDKKQEAVAFCCDLVHDAHHFIPHGICVKFGSEIYDLLKKTLEYKSETTVSKEEVESLVKLLASTS